MIPKLKKKLTLVFNKFIRLRDYGLCISCGLREVAHAGHYYSRGSQWAMLTYDETNVNGQCAYCNVFLEGNKQGYREGLIKKYGKGVENMLKVKISLAQKARPWTRFEYLALIDHYKKKTAVIENKRKGDPCSDNS